MQHSVGVSKQHTYAVYAWWSVVYARTDGSDIGGERRVRQTVSSSEGGVWHCVVMAVVMAAVVVVGRCVK